MNANQKAPFFIAGSFGDQSRAEKWCLILLRVALGVAFLNGIASRFGLYGKNVGYGNYANYMKYAGEVNSFLPASVVPILANAATAAELGLGLLLVFGLWVRWAAYGSAVLLAMFGTAMAISFGLVSPLDYSVFTACAGALVVAVFEERRLAEKAGAQ